MILEATENHDTLSSYASNLVRGWAVRLLFCGLASIAFGCALTAEHVVSHYSLNYPIPTRDKEPALPGTLMVYRFLMVPSEESLSVVIPGSDASGSSPPEAFWRENPADMVTDLLIRDLDESGLFEKTVGQFSSLRYRYALEGTIRKFRGIIRKDKPLAIIEVEVNLTDFDAPRREGRIALQRQYEVEVPCENYSAQATVKALKRAVRDLSTRLRRDIREAFEKPDSEEAPRRTRALSRSEECGSVRIAYRSKAMAHRNYSASIDGT